MLAITPVDCGDRCFLAEPLFFLSSGVLAFLWFCMVVKLTSRTLRGRLIGRQPRPERLTRADVFFAGQDAVLFGAFALLVSPAAGWTSHSPAIASVLAIPTSIVWFSSAWFGAFLVLLGVRSRSPTASAAFMPALLTGAAAAAAFPVIGTTVAVILGPSHPGPCVAVRPDPVMLLPGLMATGTLATAFGSMVGRFLT